MKLLRLNVPSILNVFVWNIFPDKVIKVSRRTDKVSNNTLINKVNYIWHLKLEKYGHL